MHLVKNSINDWNWLRLVGAVKMEFPILCPSCQNILVLIFVGHLRTWALVIVKSYKVQMVHDNETQGVRIIHCSLITSNRFT